MKVIKWILSLLFVGAIIYFLSKVDFSEMLIVLKGSNYALLALALFFVLIVYVLKIFRLMLITSYYGSKISFKNSMITQITSIALASFTPARMGEFSKIYLLNRYGIKGVKSFGIMVLERLLDLIIVVSFGLILLVMIMDMKDLTLLLILLFVLIIIGFIFIMNLNRFLFLIPKKLHKYVKGMKLNFYDVRLYLIILMSLFSWTVDGVVFYIIIKSLGSYLPIMVSIGVIASVTLIGLLSVLPSGLGAMEVSIFLIFEKLGLTNEISLAVLLILRILTFVIPLILIVSIMPMMDFNVFKLRKKIE